MKAVFCAGFGNADPLLLDQALGKIRNDIHPDAAVFFGPFPAEVSGLHLPFAVLPDAGEKTPYLDAGNVRLLFSADPVHDDGMCFRLRETLGKQRRFAAAFSGLSISVQMTPLSTYRNAAEVLDALRSFGTFLSVSTGNEYSRKDASGVQEIIIPADEPSILILETEGWDLKADPERITL